MIKNKKKKKKNLFGLVSTFIIFLIVFYGISTFLKHNAKEVYNNIKKLYIIKKTVTVGNHKFKVMVASNSEEWRQGLMGVKELPANEGMLFVFNKKVDYPFWMKNTLIPLTVLFIYKNKVVNQINMKPCVTKKCSFYYPFVYYDNALEINRTNQMFINKKIKIGR